MKHLPNMITLFRILLVPLTWVLFLVEPFDWGRWALGLPVPVWGILFVILAGASDILDGILARKLDVQSTIGKLLDPIADKIFITTCWIFLLYLGRLHPIGVVLAISRDVMINVLRTYAASQGVVIAASAEAKVKTTFQFISVAFLIHGSFAWFFPWVSMLVLGKILFWVALVMSYLTFVKYWKACFMKKGSVQSV